MHLLNRGKIKHKNQKLTAKSNIVANGVIFGAYLAPASTYICGHDTGRDKQKMDRITRAYSC